jgi:Tol biopolymer transport system component
MTIRRWIIALAVGSTAAGGFESASAQGTFRASVDSAGLQANDSSWLDACATTGRFVAFESKASNLVPGDGNRNWDVFVHDFETGATECVSLDPNLTVGNGWSGTPAISADGRFVAFNSTASTLVAGDANRLGDVFLRDRQTGTTELVTVSSSGMQADAYGPSVISISADGRFVAFYSTATNLVAGDTNGVGDIFVRDRQAGTTERVSVDSAGIEADDKSAEPAISADGRFVTFFSAADNLVAGDSNRFSDVFVRDLLTGTTERVSVDSSGVEGNAISLRTSISADGRLVAFQSWASNLVPDDKNQQEDIFIHDRQTGVTELVSLDWLGRQAAGGSSYDPSISADGRFVAFSSDAFLVENDYWFTRDVFVRDRQRGSTRRVSESSDGTSSGTDSDWAAISPDGRYVSFMCKGPLVDDDTNGVPDIYLHDQGVQAAWSTYGDGFAGTLGVPDLTSQSDPCLGTVDCVSVGNSSDTYTVALLLAGLAKADLPTGKGGSVLVDPLLSGLFSLTPWAPLSIDYYIPDDPSFSGIHVYLQAIEIDPGAAKGLSFTPGLDLLLGV